MYVINSDEVENVKKFYCKEEVYKYLVSLGFCLFGRKNDFYVFVETEKLLEAMINAPQEIKVSHALTMGGKGGECIAKK